MLTPFTHGVFSTLLCLALFIIFFCFALLHSADLSFGFCFCLSPFYCDCCSASSLAIFLCAFRRFCNAFPPCFVMQANAVQSVCVCCSICRLLSCPTPLCLCSKATTCALHSPTGSFQSAKESVRECKARESSRS